MSNSNYISKEVFVEFGTYPNSDEYRGGDPIVWQIMNVNNNIIGLVHQGVYDFQIFNFTSQNDSWSSSTLFDILQKQAYEIFTPEELSVLYPVEQYTDTITPMFCNKNYITIPTKIEIEICPKHLFKYCNPHKIWTRTIGNFSDAWVYDTSNNKFELQNQFCSEAAGVCPIIYVDLLELCNSSNIKFKIYK